MNVIIYEKIKNNYAVVMSQDNNGLYIVTLANNHGLRDRYQTEKEYRTENRTRALRNYFNYCKEIEQ